MIKSHKLLKKIVTTSDKLVKRSHKRVKRRVTKSDKLVKKVTSEKKLQSSEKKKRHNLKTFIHFILF